MIWVAFSALAVATLLLLIWPLIRPRANVAIDGPALAIYREQLAELERDVARGLVAADAADAARREIERRLLAADRRQAEAGATAGSIPRRGLAAGLVVALPLAALGLYVLSGAPNLPSAPTAARDADRVQAFTPETVERIAALRAQANAGSAEAWGELGGIYLETRRYAQAVEAFAAARAQFPGSAVLAALHGEALVYFSRGFVSQTALDAFREALQLNPAEPRATYYMGLFEYQSGRSEAALDIWADLARRSETTDAWMAILVRRIVDTAEQLKRDPSDYLEPSVAMLVGGDVAAAAMAKMSEEERRQAIEQMVDRLAVRLEDDPNNLRGWIRLARSRLVLEDYAAAAEAFQRADEIMPQQSASFLMDWAGALIRSASGPSELPPKLGEVMARVLALQPDNQDALWFAGVVAAQARDFDTAATHWQHLLAVLPEESDVRPAVVRALDVIAGAR